MALARSDFKGQAEAFIQRAVAAGKINNRRAGRLMSRLDNPRQRERMRARTVKWLTEEEGKNLPLTADAADIDWESFFTKFFEKWLPIILALFNIA